MKKVYIVIEELDDCSSNLIGVYSSFAKAKMARIELAETLTNECFMIDPKESGLNIKTDYEKIYKECYDSIRIETKEVII